MSEITQDDIFKRIEGLEDETQKLMVCTLVGHSKITTFCFGYHHCARCDAQIGDSLGGLYDSSKDVVVGHDCEICRANFAALDWRHTLLAPDPFSKETTT
ncbi:hypothetical protein [Pseudomonas arsenicoxydans]|uniref:hypothetical protein n=1 Tax=Pseudomonas arsenicoxydans TaxID=702115 RepID=UPI00112AEC6E|nr:hypothetical protein [Pseudomonas arsenicoxydans]